MLGIAARYIEAAEAQAVRMLVNGAQENGTEFVLMNLNMINSFFGLLLYSEFG